MSETNAMSDTKTASRWTSELPSWALLALMYASAAIAWSRVPARMPVHWNIHGQVDGYGGRFPGLLLLPLIATGIYFLLRFLPRIDPGRGNYARFQGTYDLLRASILGFMAAVHLLTIASALGRSIRMASAMPALLGLLFVVLGATMGKLRPNWFVGVRTPWTLSSKTAWIRTHRLSGWLFTASGAFALVMAAAAPGIALLATIVALLVPAPVVVIYSYLVWRHADDRLPPAGTSSAE